MGVRVASPSFQINFENLSFAISCIPSVAPEAGRYACLIGVPIPYCAGKGDTVLTNSSPGWKCGSLASRVSWVFDRQGDTSLD